LKKLDEKVAIITGGAAGIGLATAKRMVADGARVMLVDIQADQLNAAVESLGTDVAACCVADVTQEEQVQAYVDETMNRFGRVDVLFNNAGIEGAVNFLLDYPLEMFDKVMAVNVRGVWLGLQCVIPAMLKSGGGSIICTSSLAGLKGAKRASAYIASKHAVVGLVKSTAIEYASKNIRINAINPGPINTRMIHALESGIAPDQAEVIRKHMESSVPMRRYGGPEEVANLVAFLASDESSYCTGTCFSVDGGMNAT
jgi:NAD(P)-dependent dehydrogenase (short-subunit alcohol dehydrogenase family)